MVRTLLIMIDSDPRKSSRPAEAVRIAAGVGAWNKVQVHLSFQGESVRCLDEFADELQNGELFVQYLPAISSHGGRLLVERNNPNLVSIKATVPFERIAPEQMREFAAGMDHVMRF